MRVRSEAASNSGTPAQIAGIIDPPVGVLWGVSRSTWARRGGPIWRPLPGSCSPHGNDASEAACLVFRARYADGRRTAVESPRLVCASCQTASGLTCSPRLFPHHVAYDAELNPDGPGPRDRRVLDVIVARTERRAPRATRPVRSIQAAAAHVRVLVKTVRVDGCLCLAGSQVGRPSRRFSA